MTPGVNGHLRGLDISSEHRKQDVCPFVLRVVAGTHTSYPRFRTTVPDEKLVVDAETGVVFCPRNYELYGKVIMRDSGR